MGLAGSLLGIRIGKAGEKSLITQGKDMSVIKSFAVGNGDMFYIRHNSDNFTIIDCDLSQDNATGIIDELKREAAGKGIVRFISTHPDEDHIGGIHLLDEKMPINNFYVVKNKATKADVTPSFQRYCELRDGSKAFYVEKDVTRKWMNQSDSTRQTSGISILWPDIDNPHFQEAMRNAEEGDSPNDISAVIRYKLENGASFMWLGDLHTDFMKEIVDDIDLQKTTVVFASHHGRHSGRIPHSWLRQLDPQIIVLGEGPSRHMITTPGTRPSLRTAPATSPWKRKVTRCTSMFQKNMTRPDG